MTERKFKTSEELDKFDKDGYSCGDCKHFETCVNLGVHASGIICYKFDIEHYIA